MAVEFYDVKKRKKVSIDESNVLRDIVTAGAGGRRFIFRGRSSDGRILIKFVTRGDWEAMDKMSTTKSGLEFLGS